MIDRCICLNLDRRPDRWQDFLAGLPDPWPLPEVQRRAATDCHGVQRPDWYHRQPGAWGCRCSHLALWREIAASGETVGVLEDDACFGEGFADRVVEYLACVPSDWDMIYLGGQHLHHRQLPPKLVNPLVVRGWNVNRLHAYVMRPEFARIAADHIERTAADKHIDHHLGEIHARHKIYCPVRWLVGQRAGFSDIALGRKREDFFHHA